MCRMTPYSPTLQDLFKGAGVSQREAAAALEVSPALVNRLLKHGSLPKRGWSEIKERIVSFLEGKSVGRTFIDEALDGFERHVEDTNIPSNKAESEEEPMILKKQTLSMKARQAFGMVRNPFGDLREAEDIYWTPENRYVWNLMYDTAVNGGFLAVIGESGSGKSTLKDELIETVNADNGKTVIVEPYVLTMAEKEGDGKPMIARHITEAVMSVVAPDESIPSSPERQSQKLHRVLKAAYAAGTRYCVVIEEAHDLNRHTLKSLKRFLELKEGRHPLLSIILIGQTELETKLSPTDPRMREVVQRCDVTHMNPIMDVGAYLRHRFERAGIDFGKMFTDDGVAAIQERLTIARDRSGDGLYKGYPLAIANIAIAALNLATATGEKQVTADVVRMVRP